MNFLLLLLIIICISVQNIAKKSYNIRTGGGVYSFSAGSATAAVLVFLITSGGRLTFKAETFGWSIAFAAAYSVSVIASMLAIRWGPLSLTSLIVSCSLIIPTLFGLLFLNEPVSEWLILGIVLLLMSLLLINIERKTSERKITLKWGICILMAFIGNGVCSTVQKLQQLASGGRYKNELMILALLITIVVMALLSGITERKNALTQLKQGLGYYTVCGLSNGVTNYLTLVLANRMPASVMFPVISAGGVVLAALIAIFVYKEKLQPQQWLGMLLGTLAVIALNL